jgi:hypothetical protein
MDSNAVGTLVTPGSRRTKLQWLAASIALVVMVIVVVPARQIRMGERELNGLVGSYLYEIGHENGPGPAITDLRISDVYQPTTMRVEWTGPSPYGHFSVTYDVIRSLGGTQQLATTTAYPYYNDSFSWSLNSEYRYAVRFYESTSDWSLGLPYPPPGANSSDIHVIAHTSAGPWSYIAAKPIQTTVTDNQTVDSRYDLRFSTYTNLDHNFGTTSYRGGLYVGYAADPGRVGRSFLNFTTSAASPSGDTCWAGRVYGYYVRSMATGSATVGLQSVSNSWSGSTLKWSNAPSLTPGSPLNSVTVTHGTPGWYSWNVNAALTGTTMASPFAAGLASTSETSNAWAYFAKKEWDSAYAPYLLYVTGGAR